MKSYFNRTAGDFFDVDSARPPTVIGNIAERALKKGFGVGADLTALV